jgi:hypothetical protein
MASCFSCFWSNDKRGELAIEKSSVATDEVVVVVNRTDIADGHDFPLGRLFYFETDRPVSQTMPRRSQCSKVKKINTWSPGRQGRVRLSA